MPRNPVTGVFTRVSNSFSEPVVNTVIDPNDATQLWTDYDSALTNSIPKEPTLVTVDGAVGDTDATVAVQKTAPTKTELSLPSVLARDGLPLHVVDWSTSVTDHEIELTPNGSETIMTAATWSIYSNSAQLGSLTLYPSTVLNGWYIAP